MPQNERETRFQAVEAYIKRYYIAKASPSVLDALGRVLSGGRQGAFGTPPSGQSLKSILDAVVKMTDKSFAEHLLFLMERSGKAPVDIYTKAGITKQHFYKIKSTPDYKPTKETALAFAVALRLTLDETKDLIGRAGYSLSHSSKSDLIVEYFIKEGIYDVDEINYNLNVRGLGTLTNRRCGL